MSVVAHFVGGPWDGRELEVALEGNGIARPPRSLEVDATGPIDRARALAGPAPDAALLRTLRYRNRGFLPASRYGPNRVRYVLEGTRL